VVCEFGGPGLPVRPPHRTHELPPARASFSCSWLDLGLQMEVAEISVAFFSSQLEAARASPSRLGLARAEARSRARGNFCRIFGEPARGSSGEPELPRAGGIVFGKLIVELRPPRAGSRRLELARAEAGRGDWKSSKIGEKMIENPLSRGSHHRTGRSSRGSP
jgi:hypothetical protein